MRFDAQISPDGDERHSPLSWFGAAKFLLRKALFCRRCQYPGCPLEPRAIVLIDKSLPRQVRNRLLASSSFWRCRIDTSVAFCAHHSREYSAFLQRLADEYRRHKIEDYMHCTPYVEFLVALFNRAANGECPCCNPDCDGSEAGGECGTCGGGS